MLLLSWRSRQRMRRLLACRLCRRLLYIRQVCAAVSILDGVEMHIYSVRRVHRGRMMLTRANADIKLSSFFSLHRPLSISAPIPPPTTRSTFNAIFEQRPSKSAAKFDDVIYTLSSTVSALDAATGEASSNGQQSSEEKDLRWEVLHNQAAATGGAIPVESLEQLVKQFRPFNVPPPPVPFDELEMTGKRRERQRPGEHEEAASSEEEVYAQQEQQSATTHKTYKTTLTISEATSADGSNTYTFSATPIVEHNNSTVIDTTTNTGTHLSTSSTQQTWTDPSQPFTSKLPTDVAGEARETETESAVVTYSPREMILISVKRRRQLKMKKHKYKKLMKRTRNLRRREGRL